MNTERSIVVLLLLLGRLFISCSHGPVASYSLRPSEEIIKSTITKEYERVNPRSRVEEIHIDQIGKFDEEKNYWPVRVTVVCNRREECIHTYVVEYGFYQDEYGAWKGQALKAEGNGVSP